MILKTCFQLSRATYILLYTSNSYRTRYYLYFLSVVTFQCKCRNITCMLSLLLHFNASFETVMMLCCGFRIIESVYYDYHSIWWYVPRIKSTRLQSMLLRLFNSGYQICCQHSKHILLYHCKRKTLMANLHGKQVLIGYYYATGKCYNQSGRRKIFLSFIYLLAKMC